MSRVAPNRQLVVDSRRNIVVLRKGLVRHHDQLFRGKRFFVEKYHWSAEDGTSPGWPGPVMSDNKESAKTE